MVACDVLRYFLLDRHMIIFFKKNLRDIQLSDVRLIFEDGTEFSGWAFAGQGTCYGEVVFNTAMTGYQEILTDPSYSGQMVLMTYPLIGNYGINDEDVESRSVFLNALLVREYSTVSSNFRMTRSLKDYLDAHNIMGVEGLDTRAITRFIRSKGAQRAMLTTSNASFASLKSELQSSPTMVGQNLTHQATTKEPYIFHSTYKTTLFKVAVVDCGLKLNILRLLASLGCECHVFPNSCDANEILDGSFDGLFVSNGPGDPQTVEKTIQLIKEILGKLPFFGICLGHQLLALALGGTTYKMPFGHHGANHPVKHLETGHVEITSQNHGFCVDMDSLGDNVQVTHINLNDQTVEGFSHKVYPAFSVQYHPESAPGPHDSDYLFERFIRMMANVHGRTLPEELLHVSR